MDLADAVGLARATNRSVLTTIRSNSRPQISNVLHHVGDDGLIRISITASRAKYANMRRTPWAALHANGSNFWTFAVIEADVSLSEVAAGQHDATVEELVAMYRALSGEHPDWDEYRTAMVADRRVVARLAPNRAYGKLS